MCAIVQFKSRPGPWTHLSAQALARVPATGFRMLRRRWEPHVCNRQAGVGVSWSSVTNIYIYIYLCTYVYIYTYIYIYISVCARLCTNLFVSLPFGAAVAILQRTAGQAHKPGTSGDLSIWPAARPATSGKTSGPSRATSQATPRPVCPSPGRSL